MDLISIIIPVYNSEKYLSNCLESVLNQTYNDLEIILVDDASSDSSGTICDEYSSKDKRVKVIHHKKNKGLSLSKYDGYKLATGEWISFIDNDDLITKFMYAELSELASQNNEAEIICLAGEDIDSQNINTRIDSINPNIITFNTDIIRKVDGLTACRLLYGNVPEKDTIKGIYSATWGKIIKRSLFDNALDKTIKFKDRLYWIFLEDVLFIPICMQMANQVIISNKVCYLHRMSEANLSASIKPSEYHYETISANDIIQDYYRSSSLEDVADNMLKGLLLNLQSVWYKVYRFETDQIKRDNGLKMMNTTWAKYIKLYRSPKNRNRDILANISIYLFDLSKKIWLYSIGDLHFKHRI